MCAVHSYTHIREKGSGGRGHRAEHMGIICVAAYVSVCLCCARAFRVRNVRSLLLFTVEPRPSGIAQKRQSFRRANRANRIALSDSKYFGFLCVCVFSVEMFVVNFERTQTRHVTLLRSRHKISPCVSFHFYLGFSVRLLSCVCVFDMRCDERELVRVRRDFWYGLWVSARGSNIRAIYTHAVRNCIPSCLLMCVFSSANGTNGIGNITPCEYN